MSEITIFIFGCGVMGIVLAATFVAAIAGENAETPKAAELNR